MPRADPKRPASGFDNFVENLTGFVAADTGDEDRTRGARFVVTPPLRSALLGSVCLQESVLPTFEYGKGSRTRPLG